MQHSDFQRRTLGDTSVYLGKDAYLRLLPELRSVFEEGALVVLYEKEYESLASALMHELKKGGYRVFAKCVFDDASMGVDGDIPEFVRYVFCVGAHSAISIARELADSLGVCWSLYVTAPIDDSIMCEKSPKQVFIDENVLIKCRSEQIAAGYGLLLSSRLTAFESIFYKKVLALDVAELKPFDRGELPLEELEWELLKITYESSIDSASRAVGKVMRALAVSKGRQPRLDGEYRLLASCLLSTLYSAFLGSPSIDCALPPCVSEDTDKLAELGINVENSTKCIDFFDVSRYFRISYVLSEYRLDLLERLAGADMHGVERFWRRLYPDAGYWLKQEITASEALYCARLAGVLDKGLLHLVYVGGLMNGF